jgi:hypothetical protein
MIYKIADLLKDEISGLNFVDIAVGLAKPTVVKVPTPGDDVTLTPIIVPMAYNSLNDPCLPGDLLPMVPDTTKMSIHFWEDQGVELLDEDTYYYHSQANLRLVSWWNLPLINSSYTDASLLVANLIAEIPEELTTVDYLSQIQVIFNGEETGTNVIAAYNFDEPENQFTTYPYFYTALNYVVQFAFGKNCVDAVVLNPSACP